jgi:hypothetical protein
MASAVDAEPMAPVTTGAMKPAAQKAPAGHGPLQAGAERLIAAPYVPAGHGTGVTEPSGQKEPSGHAAVHVLAERPVVAPYVPAGHAVGALAAAGQYEPAGHGTCVVLAVVGYGQKEPAAHWFAVPVPLLSARHEPAAHAVGALEPAAHEKPTGHAIAGRAPGQYVPATQVAAEHTPVWPAVADVPAAHGAGAVAPRAQ